MFSVPLCPVSLNGRSPVPKITNPWQNVELVIDFWVNCCGDNLDMRKCISNGVNSYRIEMIVTAVLHTDKEMFYLTLP